MAHPIPHFRGEGLRPGEHTGCQDVEQIQDSPVEPSCHCALDELTPVTQVVTSASASYLLTHKDVS